MWILAAPKPTGVFSALARRPASRGARRRGQRSGFRVQGAAMCSRSGQGSARTFVFRSPSRSLRRCGKIILPDVLPALWLVFHAVEKSAEKVPHCGKKVHPAWAGFSTPWKNGAVFSTQWNNFARIFHTMEQLWGDFSTLWKKIHPAWAGFSTPWKRGQRSEFRC